MNRANALLLVVAGAAAPGAAITYHLPGIAQLAAYGFVVGLAAIVWDRLPVNTPEPEQLTIAPTVHLDYQPMSIITTRLDQTAYTGVTERLDRCTID